MTRTRSADPVEELSDKALRERVKRSRRTISEIDRASPAEVVRSGEADSTLARYGAAIEAVQLAEAELGRRETRSIIERLPLVKQLRDAKRQPHPAGRWLDSARRYSAPELQGETLVAARLSDEDAAELERLVRKKRELVSDEHAEALTSEETAAWEQLLGKAAGDEGLFAKKRQDALARAKLNELKDARRVASLPREPLLAEPGAVQIPRFVFRWLVSDEAREGGWTLADLGLLAALLGSFANRDPSLIVGAHFEEEAGELTLVIPSGIGGEIKFHGRIAGSPHEHGSGFVRAKSALATLARNNWLVVEQTVSELRIRRGERANKLREDASA